MVAFPIPFPLSMGAGKQLWCTKSLHTRPAPLGSDTRRRVARQDQLWLRPRFIGMQVTHPGQDALAVRCGVCAGSAAGVLAEEGAGSEEYVIVAGG